MKIICHFFYIFAFSTNIASHHFSSPQRFQFAYLKPFVLHSKYLSALFFLHIQGKSSHPDPHDTISFPVILSFYKESKLFCLFVPFCFFLYSLLNTLIILKEYYLNVSLVYKGIKGNFCRVSLKN